ncbi:tetratricopeptide repeat protein [Streptomyces sp. B6B3]|uniref:tetratricopeptide repeat protein n=1 Tax=Streptomyces sp. B6B3 TaxID=3153570 RepID=UPI00325CCF63
MTAENTMGPGDRAGDRADWERRVVELWDSLDDDTDEAAFRAAMAGLVAELPADDPVGHFEMASAYDSTGGEAEAAEHYRRALDGGLGDVDPYRRSRTAVQYASTLRNLGRVEEGIALLRAEPPGGELGDAVAAVLALSLTDAGREREAVVLLLHALSDHLPRYQRSMHRYADALLAD